MSTEELKKDLNFLASKAHFGGDGNSWTEQCQPRLDRLYAALAERYALKAEVERLTPLQFRPAPCHAACEATAFNIEIRNLKAELEAVEPYTNTKVIKEINNDWATQIEKLQLIPTDSELLQMQSLTIKMLAQELQKVTAQLDELLSKLGAL